MQFKNICQLVAVDRRLGVAALQMAAKMHVIACTQLYLCPEACKNYFDVYDQILQEEDFIAVVKYNCTGSCFILKSTEKDTKIAWPPYDEETVL